MFTRCFSKLMLGNICNNLLRKSWSLQNSFPKLLGLFSRTKCLQKLFTVPHHISILPSTFLRSPLNLLFSFKAFKSLQHHSQTGYIYWFLNTSSNKNKELELFRNKTFLFEDEITPLGGMNALKIYNLSHFQSQTVSTKDRRP